MDIAPAVIVAIVSGAASVLAALFSLRQANRVAQLKTEADLLLEKFKADDAKRRRAFELATEESEPGINALAQAWSEVQAVRDVISRVVAPARYDQDLALETLRAAMAGISAGYGRWGASLPAGAENASHSAKNIAAVVESLVAERGTGPAPNPEAPGDVDDRLRELRASLRDHQAAIQQSLLTMRSEHMARILEAM